jgi:polyisoprenyl-phosphate glycosyltransferase
VTAPQRLDHPLLRFLLVGGTTVLVDAVTYFLLNLADVPVDLAKAISFVVGAVFAYFANWRFTFGARRSRWSEVLFVVVYLLALGLNVAANAAVRAWLGTSALDASIAFLVATGLSAAWNFVGMSLFVFRREESPVGHVAER